MLTTVTEQGSKADILDLMEDLVRRWFDGKFDTLTEPQAFAVPLIHAGENVIVSSPTGSGKTLTAFLSVINELYALQKQDELEDKIYCLYVSPLKALANDINRNLRAPLEEMEALAEAERLEAPQIRVAVRSGDTSASERQKQARRPPHIFITTPESLAIILSTPVFRRKFQDVRWVILDEIHEICSNKRGAHLSLSLERLSGQVTAPFMRIGLSATIAPMEQVAKFLAGYEEGRLRPMNVVEVESQKRLDMRVLCPVRDMTALPFEVVNARMYDQLKGMIDDHRTTLIFTNTRSGTERVSVKLKDRGVEELEAHHGSLSKFVRLDVEERLKAGELNAVVSSTSLELGIDIGYIDLVAQVGSPKSIAKGLQRVGRAGHAYGNVSVGRLIVFENDDLLECAALVRAAYENSIDRVDIPTNSLDVLAQTLVGMSLEQRWEIDDALALVRRSYCYRDLSRKEFLSVLRYLSSRNPDVSVYAKVWLDEDEGRFGRKRGSRMIYFTNVGTIPEEGNYRVITHRGVTMGTLSEKFVEQLTRHDVFVLGGRTYRFERVRGMKVFVKDASGRRPTVPSWTGEMLPRSFDLSLQVGRLRQEVLRRVDAEGEAAAMAWLEETCRVDMGSARSLVNYMLEQRAMVPQLPTDEAVVLEGYIDTRGNRNIVFHYCFGRRTNDALARAYAFAISNALECNARISVTDDNFMITIPKRVDLEEIPDLLKSDALEDLLRRALRNTELFKQRFRHCATRSFMILRNYRGHQVSVGRQQIRSQRVLDWLHELEDFPVIQESYNEILNGVMDLRHARQVLLDIEEGRIQVRTTSWSNVPSPLAHNVVLAGISDIVLMEDRSAMLRDLHRKVLRRVVPEDQLQEVQFTEEQVQTYFRQKAPRLAVREDLLPLLEQAGALNLLRQKGRNVYDLAEAEAETVRGWCEKSVTEGEVASVWTPKGVLWVSAADVPAYAAVYARRRRLRTLDRQMLTHLGEEAKTAKELGQELGVPRVQVNDALRRLERGYHLGRRGLSEATYEAREIEAERFEEALDRLIVRLLGFQGPMTLEELAYELDLKGEMLREALNGLVNEAALVSGHFVVDEAYQYLVARDLRRLEAREQALPTFEETAVRSYLLAKQFDPLDSLDAYFERFLEAGVLFDISHRVEGFDIEEWYRRREAGDILEGRFLHGRVRYVRRDEAPLFASAYRRPPLGPLEARVLDAVEEGDGLDLDQVTQVVGADRGRVKEALHALDRGLYVIRKFTGSDAWTTKNFYVAFEPGDPVPDAQEAIVRRFLRAYGPVSPSGVKGYTGFGYAEAEGIVERLLEQGVATKILVQGDGDVEMVLLTEELPSLQAVPVRAPTDALRILSLQDPWIQPMWAEVNSRYGDGWYYPVVKDGKLVGMVEKWQMSGCLEVREIELDDTGHVPELLHAIQGMMDFYGQRGYEIVRVVGAFGKSVLDAGISGAFEEAGFHRTNDFFAWGNMVSQQHSWEEVLSYVFYRQGIHRDRRFKDAFAAVEALGGLRSDFASILRTRRFTPMKELFAKGLVVKGLAIPPYATYCTPEDLELYRAAKAVPLEDDMEEVWELIRESEPISKRRLIALAPFPEMVTERALRKLYRASYVTRDPHHRYRSIGDAGLEPMEAKKAVLRKVFEGFGIFSAENLGAYTRGHFRMGEIRRILRELEQEGALVKGFLIEGEPNVYWMLKDDLLGQVTYTGQFVLSPRDNLSFYLRDFLHERWRMGSCYSAFDGPRTVAAFTARKRGDELMITEYQGDSAAQELLRAFAYQNDLSLQAEGEDTDDWELIRWYERMYGGVRD